MLFIGRSTKMAPVVFSSQFDVLVHCMCHKLLDISRDERQIIVTPNFEKMRYCRILSSHQTLFRRNLLCL